MTEQKHEAPFTQQISWPGLATPANEEKRMDVTRKLQLLGKGAQPALQRYVDLVATVLKRDVSMLTLFDVNYAEVINSTGELETTDRRMDSICAWSLVPDSPEVLMIPDLTKDARFSHYSLVTKEPYMRSYLGAPIVLAGGYRVGNLCTLDAQQRSLSAAVTRLLVNVASLVARELEGMQGTKDHLYTQPKIHSSRQRGLMMLATNKPGWLVLHCSCDALHLSPKQTEGRPLWELFAVHNMAHPDAEFKASLSQGDPFRVMASMATPSGHHDVDGDQFQLNFRPGDSDLPEEYLPIGTQVGTPAWVADCQEGKAQVAAHWFVFITSGNDKAQRSHVSFDTTQPPATHRASTDRPVETVAEESADAASPADVQGGWEDVQVGYLVGRGSTGSVYRAICNGQQVAVKIIAAAQDKYIKRTPDGIPMEVALTKDLRHPNIVRTLRHASFNSQNASLTVLTEGSNWTTSSGSLWDQNDAEHLEEDDNNDDNDTPPDPPPETWLLMDYCDKGCLLDAVDKGWLLTQPSHLNSKVCLKKLLLTALELATALAYLHGVDIMHGDLTGGNIMLHSAPVTASDPRGFTIKVADFGMSRIYSHLEHEMTQGTITHMPPELISTNRMHRSADVWSFGVLLWEMYHGQRAWGGMSYTQLMQAIGCEKKRPQWPSNAPQEVANLGAACLHLNPEQRPTFRQVAQQLDSMIACHQVAGFGLTAQS